MSDWQPLGPHRYRIVDGLVWMQSAGDFSAEQTSQFVDVVMAWDERQDECGALLDVRGGIGIPAAARRVMAQRVGKSLLPLPVAVIGASLTARALLTLMINALRLVLRNEVPMAFFHDENAALAWLKPKVAERAERLRARKQT